MGKALIIKNADFSAVSFDNISENLPDAYKRVSKIFNTYSPVESSVSHAFDTGIYITPEYSIRCCNAFIATRTNWAGFFQDYTDEQTIVTRVIRKQTNNQLLAFYISDLPDTGGTLVNIAVNTSLPNVYEIKGTSLFINGSLVATQTQAPSSLPKTTTLKIGFVDVAICGNFVIRDENGAFVFYGIPCVRKSDDFAGIYDIISNSFISNGLKNEYEE